MSIPSTSLPPPSYVGVKSDYNRTVSEEGMMVFTHRTDSSVQSEQYRLSWEDASPEVLSACLLHYETHAVGTFKWTAPKDSSIKTWRWLSAPSIKINTARSASIVGEIERVLAFIP